MFPLYHPHVQGHLESDDFRHEKCYFLFCRVPILHHPPYSRRLSRALVHFKESCKNSKRHRRLKLGLRTVRELSEWRPTKGRWCRWKAFLQKARVKEAFSAWVKASQRERRIGEAAHVIRARKEASVMVDVWNAWRRAAGAAKLGWLLGAWGVIGPMRSAVEVMQASAKMARAEQWRRLHLLR